MKPQDTDPYTDPECYGDDLGGCCFPMFVGLLIFWAAVLVAIYAYVWPR
jgi:hypothetical protein